MYSLHREQIINTSLGNAWEFIKNPLNLNRITPDDLNFRIVSEVPQDMYNGMIIDYRVRIPLFGSQTWVTEIKHIRNRHSFVDEQRIGPYSFWYHYHEIGECKEGVLFSDTVYYAVPLWIFGRIIHFLYIEKALKRIFDFRKEKFIELLELK